MKTQLPRRAFRAALALPDRTAAGKRCRWHPDAVLAQAPAQTPVLAIQTACERHCADVLHTAQSLAHRDRRNTVLVRDLEAAARIARTQEKRG